MADRSRAVLALSLALGAAPAQRWSELQGRTKSGAVALHQAVLDAGSDALVLLVASHPDDRYVLPAVFLRYRFGARIAVLLASRGGGGQNSTGPETGDALERIRTFEAEAGCWNFDGDVYYLNRPDRGFRRSAAETFAEWGRDETRDELVRLVRTIRPDVVVTTHSAEETHGHDLALAELLPEAVARAADPAVTPGEPHRVRALFLGATSTPSPRGVVLDADAFEPVRGATFRRLGYEVLLRHHLSPGPPAPMETVFEARTVFVPVELFGDPPPKSLLDGVATLLDPASFPGTAAQRQELEGVIADLPSLSTAPERLLERALAGARLLASLQCAPGSDLERRRARRLDAMLRTARHADAIQIEAEARPGAVAVPGEELDLDVRVHVGGPRGVDDVRVAAAHGEALLEPVDSDTTAIAAGGELHAALSYRVPLVDADAEARNARFRADRFEPPVALRFLIGLGGVDVPVDVVVPVHLRPAVELDVAPRMLLLPMSSGRLRFTVKVERNSAFPVDRELDLRCPAGYRIEGPRTRVQLDTIRRDIFEFSLTAPTDRRSGVDVVRIGLGSVRVVLPVHKVDVSVDQDLRVGVVRSVDDALSSVIGAGGFGLHWSSLSENDLAVGDLTQFDTIVVDVRALRDRPEARQSFRRLLEFCQQAGHRLVVFYHKDIEFAPPGEGFTGAPFQPFQIGHNRVTRPDAPIRLLRPEHVLFRSPNVIQAGDWDGWEQERALYLPQVYADAYQELIEMQDPGQPVERSALLYARAGDGEYIYCALALWRQLKKLHPGSVRLLANLLTPSPAHD
jgi:LmbE family N-acetylglucosaminyl deacetylase